MSETASDPWSTPILAHLCTADRHDECPGLAADLAFVITGVCGCECHGDASLTDRLAWFEQWSERARAYERRLLDAAGFQQQDSAWQGL